MKNDKHIDSLVIVIDEFNEAFPRHGFRVLISEKYDIGRDWKKTWPSAWETGDSGPAKRCFALTPNGRTCLARWIATLRTYRDAVGNLLDTAASSSAANTGRRVSCRAATPKGDGKIRST